MLGTQIITPYFKIINKKYDNWIVQSVIICKPGSKNKEIKA